MNQSTEADTRRIELIWEMDEAIRQIARMKVVPDDNTNRASLSAAIRTARDVLYYADVTSRNPPRPEGQGFRRGDLR